MKKLIGVLMILSALMVPVAFVMRGDKFPVSPGGAIIISGASSGIGRKTAESLAEEGYVVYAGVRKDADLTSINDLKIKNLIPVILDVTNDTNVEEVRYFVEKDTGMRDIKISALINNAGASYAGPNEGANIDKAKWLFDVNYYGPMRLITAFGPMIRKDQGRIIQISSVMGFVNIPYFAIYCQSKAALTMLTRQLRLEMRHYNVSVSMVEPGAFDTAIQGKAKAQSSGAATDTGLAAAAHLLPGLAHLGTIRRPGDVQWVVDDVQHAVASEYPRTRYQQGYFGAYSVKLWAVLERILPDRVFDWVVMGHLLGMAY